MRTKRNKKSAFPHAIAIIILPMARLYGEMAELWFLAKVRETGPYADFAAFSGTQMPMADDAVPGENLLSALQWGCAPHGITNFGQEP
jgi:hypothetical protein